MKPCMLHLDLTCGVVQLELSLSTMATSVQSCRFSRCLHDTCTANPHFKDKDVIQRNSILLYDVELTAALKNSVVNTLSEQKTPVGKKAFSMLPKTWVQAKQSSREKARTR
eukprot:3568601-Pleurochrysis_carterae.AAC.6